MVVAVFGWHKPSLHVHRGKGSEALLLELTDKSDHETSFRKRVPGRRHRDDLMLDEKGVMNSRAGMSPTW
jgi:hypothetical protein